MTPEQMDLVLLAKDSLAAARILHDAEHHGFAASRAYYAMFYVAEAFLLEKGLAFSKHSGVHAAFGQHFCKTKVVPAEFHRYLTKAMETRQAGDYGRRRSVGPARAEAQIARAEQFIALAERLLGPAGSASHVKP